ncbi:MAG TPA: hypothetical protein VFH91_08115 [Pyrinomonadaceae bacterium]|nr:hypothetical protein [Pyrinomonadaceae bacterium]
MFSHFAPMRIPIFICLIAGTLAITSCAVFRPTDVNGPESNPAPYPILLESEGERQNNALVAWKQMAQHFGLSDQLPEIQPGTATLKNLPANASGGIVLPRVGVGPAETEEELRESLRRFIAEWRPLIGAQLDQLSLVERTDLPAGEKIARYEQHPFRYPLRGDFGQLVIRFRSDRRVTAISSTCLTDVERLQSQLAAQAPKVTSEEAAEHVKGGSLAISGSSFTVPSTAVVEVRQLVAYVKEQMSSKTALEVHLAWEVELTNAPVKTVYLDAITDEIIATK